MAETDSESPSLSFRSETTSCEGLPSSPATLHEDPTGNQSVGKDKRAGAVPVPDKTDTHMRASAPLRQLLDRLRTIGADKELDDVQETSWIESKLSRDDYQALLESIEQEPNTRGFFYDKLHYDYSASSESFVIRMPKPLHEDIISAVQLHVVSELRRLGHNGQDKDQYKNKAELEDKQQPISAAAFSRLVMPRGSPTFTLCEDEPARTPDHCFGLERSSFPGVVLEVANTQNGKDLETLADGYLLSTDERYIQLVLGIKLSDDGSNPSTVRMWHVGQKEQADGRMAVFSKKIQDEVFRTAAGQPRDGVTQIPLRYFGTVGDQPDGSHIPDNVCVNIPFTVFNKCFALKQGRLEVAAERRANGGAGWGNVLKRRREPTPPEELTPADEDRFTREEAAADRKAERDDPSFLAKKPRGG